MENGFFANRNSILFSHDVQCSKAKATYLGRYFKVITSDSNSDFDDYVADKICRRQVYDVGDGFDSCLFAYVYQYLLKR